MFKGFLQGIEQIVEGDKNQVLNRLKADIVRLKKQNANLKEQLFHLSEERVAKGTPISDSRASELERMVIDLNLQLDEIQSENKKVKGECHSLQQQLKRMEQERAHGRVQQQTQFKDLQQTIKLDQSVGVISKLNERIGFLQKQLCRANSARNELSQHNSTLKQRILTFQKQVHSIQQQRQESSQKEKAAHVELQSIYSQRSKLQTMKKQLQAQLLQSNRIILDQRLQIKAKDTIIQDIQIKNSQTQRFKTFRLTLSPQLQITVQATNIEQRQHQTTQTCIAFQTVYMQTQDLIQRAQNCQIIKVIETNQAQTNTQDISSVQFKSQIENLPSMMSPVSQLSEKSYSLRDESMKSIDVLLDQESQPQSMLKLRDRNKKLIIENARLKSSVLKNKNLKNQVTLLRSSLQQDRKKIQHLVLKNPQKNDRNKDQLMLTKELTSKTKLIQELQFKLSELRQINLRLQSQLEAKLINAKLTQKVQSQQHQLRLQINQLTQKIKEEENTIKVMQISFETLSMQKQMLQEQMGLKIAELRGQLQRRETGVKLIQKSQQQQKQLMAELKQKCQILQQSSKRYEQVQFQLINLKQQKQTLLLQVQQLNLILQNKNQELQSLGQATDLQQSVQLKALQSKIEQQDLLLQQTRLNLSQLEREYEQSVSSIQQLKIQRQQLFSKNSNLLEQKSLIAANLEQTNSKLNQVLIALRSAQEESHLQATLFKAKQLESASLLNQINMLQSFREQTRAQVNSLKSQKLTLQKQFSQAQKKLSDQSVSFSFLLSERQQLQSRASQADRIQHQRTQLSTSLKESQSKLRLMESKNETVAQQLGKLKFQNQELKGVVRSNSSNRREEQNKLDDLLKQLQDKNNYLDQLENNMKRTQQFNQREKKKNQLEIASLKARIQEKQASPKPIGKVIQLQVVRGFFLKYLQSKEPELRRQVFQTLMSVLEIQKNQLCFPQPRNDWGKGVSQKLFKFLLEQ